MQYYLLLGASSLLGGVRLGFNKLYINKYGSALRSALWFTALSCGIFFLMMLAIGQTPSFTVFSVILAVIFALINVACTLCGFATLAIGNVATYMLVLMMGGMIIPFLYGILFGGEPLTVAKAVCLILITAALFVGMERGKKSTVASPRRVYLYYALLFCLNGLACVILSIHQSTPTPFGGTAVSSQAFTMLYMLFTSLFSFICVIYLRLKRGKPNPPVKRGPDVLLSAGYGAFYGVANLISTICLLNIDSSAQFPILTGGSVVIAGIVGLFFKEKITWRYLVSSALVLVGTVVLLPWETIFA